MRGSNDTSTPALADAYRRAVYVVFGPEGPLELEAGRDCPPLDRLLAALGADHAALLTASNPGSRRLADEANFERTRRLAERIAAAGFRALPGENRDADGDWRESSFLVLEIDEVAALELGREFDQAAIAMVELGRPVRLVFT